MRSFLLIALLVWGGMHVYVFWRASSIPRVRQHVPRYVLAGLACFLFLSFVLARILDHYQLNLPGRLLEAIGTNWIGVLFLLMASFLFADVITLFGSLFPRLAVSLRGWALVAGGVLSALALVQGLRAPIVTTYEVKLARLPAELDGTVLVFAADFHAGTQLGREWFAARIDQILAQRPDIIVLGGDILEGDDPSEKDLLPSLRKLNAPFGVWGVTGNHEFHGGMDGSTSPLEENGVRLLHDRWVEVRPGLILAGVDDLTSRRRHGETGNFVEHAVAGRPANVATVLVSHTPWQADVAAGQGVGLMLSAHTHEGQIWPFGYIVSFVHPLLGGRYWVAGMPVLVCRGTGTWGPRMRLWRRGEIMRIILRSGETR